MEKESKIWLTAGSARSRPSNNPTQYTITMNDVFVSQRIIFEFNQMQMTLDRKDVIKLKEAIEKALEVKNGIRRNENKRINRCSG